MLKDFIEPQNMSDKEQISLIELIQASGCEEAKVKMIGQYLYAIEKYCNDGKTRCQQTIEERESHAYESVLRALVNFDPARGIKPATYVINCIRRSKHHRDESGPLYVPRRITEKFAEQRKAAMCVSRPSDWNDDNLSCEDIHTREIDDADEHDFKMRVVLEAVKTLPKREQDVIRMYLDNDGSQTKAGASVGWSRRRFDRGLQTAIEKLRNAIELQTLNYRRKQAESKISEDFVSPEQDSSEPMTEADYILSDFLYDCARESGRV